MKNTKYLRQVNVWIFVVIILLMSISVVVISSQDPSSMLVHTSRGLFSAKSKIQLRHFALGWIAYFICLYVDYHQFKRWAWVLYSLILFSLIGLFFVPAVQNVHRWYRIPIINLSVQPSEYAKLVVVIMLSYILEIRKARISSKTTAFIACIIVGIPFLLILKEPDLGTALVLCPIALAIFYIGNIYPPLVKVCSIFAALGILCSLLIFSGIIPHDKVKPYALKLLKEYQYERLSPSNHHQRASLVSIGVGGLKGQGWKSGEFAGRGWLPYGYTDSVFPAIGEEFGLLGLLFVLWLFYNLVCFGCRTVAVAVDDFGRFLAGGVTVHLVMHVLINVSMMSGLLPITGVPLVLISYGGSSVISTMASLGILQSIYSRRFAKYPSSLHSSP
ncbi:FtsW/RodA/SpoVE family cell cycle protein [Chlamydia suis]|uniref:Cell wall polymerase n=1 Tax=Chlamydia suis TaxID=83559 RepID=A0AAQ0ELS7_9CHLA|nr:MULTISPECIES: FtsW/RodA/SpoVE family cell cycle protein [Chlamydia]MEB2681545.1 FtsW/RodA/SpoVE family cell cycle protein [Chlamydia suis]MEB2681583.1 FtsW/RodA/SpoVE family cell cycle protein [Chlamydia suis]MEB2682504.1 FtsW/RodA/SpoVE family cell cycle protein [Chlamydia suis]MEB2684254.1 FtsW/RodA/SpoVE family cell cycle protein [Chlamydia suis]MEB2684321.1 FtsW/RodA/SpoVE family cell cycle protein [Chlamydia suis]